MIDSEDKDSGGLDPQQLLRALGSLLDSNGGAKGVPEMLRIASLMKDAKKLVARCVYAHILRSTQNGEIMEKFIQVGGWETLNIWLQDAKAMSNSPFIGELLQVYQNVPVTIELLKQNNCAKSIKQMSKSGDENLQKPCADLVTRWMEAIKAQPIPKDKASDEKRDKQKRSTSDKKDKRSSSSSQSKHKSSHGNSASKSSHSKSSSSEKSSSSSKSSSSVKSNKSEDKMKSEQRRGSDSSSSSSKSADRSKASSSSVIASASSSADKIKKITFDNANKVRTSKTAPTKFRSTGNGCRSEFAATVLSCLLRDNWQLVSYGGLSSLCRS